MFKRCIAALTVIAAIVCPVTNAEPVQDVESMVERGTVKIEYTSREVGNGNGRDNFHESPWTELEPTTPVTPPTTPNEPV